MQELQELVTTAHHVCMELASGHNMPPEAMLLNIFCSSLLYMYSSRDQQAKLLGH